VEFCGELEEEIVVVILPDTGKNYMSTLYSDDWMREQGFLEGGDKEYGR
jgi:cystathionine beta-synthase